MVQVQYADPPVSCQIFKFSCDGAYLSWEHVGRFSFGVSRPTTATGMHFLMRGYFKCLSVERLISLVGLIFDCFFRKDSYECQAFS